jgi:hypothetical protein
MGDLADNKQVAIVFMSAISGLLTISFGWSIASRSEVGGMGSRRRHSGLCMSRASGCLPDTFRAC